MFNIWLTENWFSTLQFVNSPPLIIFAFRIFQLNELELVSLVSKSLKYPWNQKKKKRAALKNFKRSIHFRDIEFEGRSQKFESIYVDLRATISPFRFLDPPPPLPLVTNSQEAHRVVRVYEW